MVRHQESTPGPTDYKGTALAQLLCEILGSWMVVTHQHPSVLVSRDLGQFVQWKDIR